MKKTNLVYVFTDQQSFDMLGCYGNQQIHTPNIDRFAEEGVRFSNCFTTAPVCTPARGILLSGMHPLHNGAFANDTTMIPGKGTYFAQSLSNAGYRTGYIGKWHLLGGERNRPVPTGELRYGFDEVFLTNNCHVDYRPNKSFYWNEDGEKTFFDEWEVYGQTRQAMEFLDEQSTDHPFALFVSWHPPHDWGMTEEGYFKYQTLPELQQMYDGKEVQLRAAVPDRSELRKQQLRDYMAQCSGTDIAFGKIMEKLKQKGLEENTLVIFTSDHGDLLGAYDWQDSCKEYPQEYATHVPLIMRQPGRLSAGVTSDLLVGTLDLMPTILGLLDIEIPASCQGSNLAESITTNDGYSNSSIPIMMMHSSIRQWRGVVTPEYLFAYQEGHVDRHSLCNVLYDRCNDPEQLHNQFNNPEYLIIRKQLMQLTSEWMARFSDPFISYEQLISSPVNWKNELPDAINRVSPVEWIHEIAKPI